MEIFRIAKEGFQELDGAGGLIYPGRWHEKGNRVIYASEHRSLAAFEALVHLSGPVIFNNSFILINIYIPDDVSILSVPDDILQTGWNNFEFNKEIQQFGTRFLKEKRYLLMKVPSVIIKQEFNYIINPAHPMFNECRVLKTEGFIFDIRLK